MTDHAPLGRRAKMRAPRLDAEGFSPSSPLREVRRILESASPWELAALAVIGMELPPALARRADATPILPGPEDVNGFEAALMARCHNRGEVRRRLKSLSLYAGRGVGERVSPPVECVELDLRFPDLRAAAVYARLSPSRIRRAIEKGGLRMGCHWRWAQEVAA